MALKRIKTANTTTPETQEASFVLLAALGSDGKPYALKADESTDAFLGGGPLTRVKTAQNTPETQEATFALMAAIGSDGKPYALNVDEETGEIPISGGGGGDSSLIKVDTFAQLKALTGTEGDVAYCDEKAGIYRYCDDCSYTPDDDILAITGDGGNTRWELLQKMSRNLGDTGWIFTDGATISAISTTTTRLALSDIAAISIKGVRISVPIGNYDITITGAAGVKFIGFNDDTLVLKQRDSLWDFNAEVPVMVVYWTGTRIAAAPQTEYHGIRDNVWHLYTHNFLGLQYVSGLSFTGNVQTDNNTNPGANDTVQYLWSTSGVVQDEDFKSTPGTGQWAQTLGSGLTSTTAAIFNFFYFTGSAVTDFAAMADRSPFIYSGTNGTPRWENNGVMTDSVTGDYIVYHFFANPMVNGWSVFGRPHNAKFTSLATALAARPTQLNWTGYAELKHIYTAIWRVNTSWSTTHRWKLVSLSDYRTVSASPVAATAPTSHANLTSLELAGAGVTWGHINDQAQTIAGIKTFTNGIDFTAQTEKTLPVDADIIPMNDSADTNNLKKVSWANIKSLLYSGFQSGSSGATLSKSAPIVFRIASPASQINQDLPSTGILAGREFFMFVSGATTTNFVKLRSSAGNDIEIIAGEGFVRVIALQDTPTASSHWLVLDVEEKYVNSSITLTNGTGASSNTGKTITFHRRNKVAHAISNTLEFTTGSGAGPSVLTNDDSVPARLRPTTYVWNSGSTVEENNSLLSSMGYFIIDPVNGRFEFRKHDTSNWASSTTKTGPLYFCASWPIA